MRRVTLIVVPRMRSTTHPASGKCMLYRQTTPTHFCPRSRKWRLGAVCLRRERKTLLPSRLSRSSIVTLRATYLTNGKHILHCKGSATVWLRQFMSFKHITHIANICQ